jgi:hypothetical protein
VFVLIPLTIALILACTGGDAPVATPEPLIDPAGTVPANAPTDPVPDADPVAGSAEGAAAGDPVATLCGSEPVIFGCPRQNGKALAVCGGAGKLQYRFGPPAAPEFVFPADPAQASSLMTLKSVSYAQSMGTVLSFQNGEVRYEVTSMIGGGGGPDAASNNFQGVYLYKGEQLVDTVNCQGEVKGDLEGASAVVALSAEP